MDTTEELNGTYFYKGLSNLTAGELFFFVFLEEAKQLGVDDVARIGFNTVSTYNRIARGDDKVW